MNMTRKNRIWLAVLCVAMVIGTFGCGQKEENVNRENSFSGTWIVDAEYAASRVGEEDTLFVDARGEKKLGAV